VSPKISLEGVVCLLFLDHKTRASLPKLHVQCRVLWVMSVFVRNIQKVDPGAQGWAWKWQDLVVSTFTGPGKAPLARQKAFLFLRRICV